MSAAVKTREQDGVLVVTIDRPEARNAVNGEVAEGVAAAMDELDARDDLRVGVLAGAGATFCAGMDLKAFLRGERPVLPGRGFAGLVERPPATPVIAAVEGYALAGGFELALACDMIVAADNAKFGLPEVKRGLVAAAGGLFRLPDRIPYHLAMEFTLTGAMVPAERAHAAGLVGRLAPAGRALDAALDLAREIAANAPLAVAASKRVIAESRDWPREESFERQAPIADAVRSSEDAREGARAFTEKRAPQWRNK
ncbi:enoyl-CoA hydratase [Spinactinospora alkalitolerans]|uniref:Enoyl-CoA hydratase n=1 Tax=Spinactinospora alkalitolerans TaxID=687207 RepID=A0A852TVJ6_9ACTN|nr:crotonase/enoyl-CoA hydratase family protein [Spinactinospora alkalitolerans]NYE47721.1 enoyl-CoA hydratase [Spinactinospora alkalitolerans]